MKILTVVVPSYNVEKYLKKTLESFAIPKVLDDLEVLIVNDGSTDGTIDVAKEFVEKYPETFFLINKENGGHGSTVNVGIEVATGRYFRIVDGDDWVEQDALVTLLHKLKTIDADLVLTNYRTVHVETGERCEFRFSDSLYDKILNVSDILERNLSFPMTTVCYKTKILKENKIKLQERIFYVDEEYNVLPFSYAKKIYFCDVILYNYRIGNINQSISIANQVNRIAHKVQVANRLIDFVESGNVSGENKEYCYRKIQGLITSIYLIMLIYNPNREEAVEIVTKLRTRLQKVSPELYQRTDKKYRVFWIMGKFFCRKYLYETLLKIKNGLGKGNGISYV